MNAGSVVALLYLRFMLLAHSSIAGSHEMSVSNQL